MIDDAAQVADGGFGKLAPSTKSSVKPALANVPNAHTAVSGRCRLEMSANEGLMANQNGRIG